jgi:hypothetical protein
MTIKLRYIAPLLAVGAAATAITAAPSASAAIVRTCDDRGRSTICQSPGNVEIHAEPRPFGARHEGF